MSSDCARASALTRWFTLPRSTRTPLLVVGPIITPSSLAPATSVISSAVAISVLLGTQSVRTAEPPTPSESTTVTSAPSWAATSAAS